MTLFSCRCPHQRGRDGKDPLDHPAHCRQSSEDQALPCTLCFVQSKVSQSVEFLSFSRVFMMQETGAGLSALAPLVGPAVSEELKGWTFYRCPLHLLCSAL